MNSRKVYYMKLVKESIKGKVIYEYCKKIIHKKHTLYLYLHINIESFPIFHFFCNRECKINWIYKIQVNKMVYWIIKHSNDDCKYRYKDNERINFSCEHKENPLISCNEKYCPLKI